MDDFDFTDYTDILNDDVGQTGQDPSVGGGDKSSVDWSSLIKDFGNAAKGFFNPKGDLGGLPLLALAALGNKAGFFNAPPTRVGFQGTIPKYTFTRGQTPYVTGTDNEMFRMRQAAQDAMATGATQDQVRDAAFRNYGISPSQFDEAMKTKGTYRRPGSGALQYFTGGQYTGAGKGLESLAANATTPSFYPAATTTESGGLANMRTGPTQRALSAQAATQPAQSQSLAVPAPGTPERAAYEQRLASQMSEADFKGLQNSPYGVLAPGFNAAVAANLRGKEELARLGLTSRFGQEILDTDSPEAVRNYLQAIQIERPMGGNITEDNDLNRLMDDYIRYSMAGEVGNAYAAKNRLGSLGVSAPNVQRAAEILSPGFSDKLYGLYYDPSVTAQRGVSGLPIDLAGLFAPGGGGNPWAVVADQKSKFGLTDEQIARGLGISTKEVTDALAQAKPPGKAAGGRMLGGLEMLANGRYLKGNGDGVSDSIPARFAGSGQEARLADGEFVVPARVVSELGNGSSDAGARKLYAMLDRVEARAKKAKRGKPSGADAELKKLA